ncbi:MAG: HAD family hydrolase [Alphaproteobacteria bacterium]|nr:HAD family hydrolase [Alphaproteobacteria bacterium]
MKWHTPDAILWDWDNTLLNSRPIAEQALKQLGQETGVSVTDDEVTEVIGGHLVDFWFRHYGPDPIPAVEKFLTYYQENNDRAVLFPETVAVLNLAQQQGIPQYVVSNKNTDILVEEAKRFHIDIYFQKIVGTHNHGVAKPEPAFADKIFGTDRPRHILMIGDGESDVAFARAIGAYSLFIRPQDAPYPYDKRVPDLAGVFAFLKEKMEG